MEKAYLEERDRALNSTEYPKDALISEDMIRDLPYPVKTHIRASGYIGQPLMYNAEVIWKRSSIRLSPRRDWDPLNTQQFNTVDPLGRVSYMKFVNMPVDGRDFYRAGKGEMKGKLMNVFTVINGKGKEVSRSSLITVFSEFLFIPSYALQDYVSWNEIDSVSAKATLRHGGHEVSGIFHFNNNGLFSRFETSDRYYSENKNEYRIVPFSASVLAYQTFDDLVFPRDILITWHLEDHEFDYFKGTIDTIIFNIDV